MKRNDKTSGFQHTAFNIRSFDIQFRGMQLFYKVCCDVCIVGFALLRISITSRAWDSLYHVAVGKGNTVRAREQEEEEGKKRKRKKRKKMKEEDKEEKTESRGEKRKKDDPSQSSTKYSPRQILQDLFQPGLFHPIFHDRDRPLIRRCCCSCHARF